jgi:NAD(P)-dependent dehydrogenase (short-subunit alcohol dehydrogenase family)
VKARYNFAGKVAVITGGTDGIGLAAAQAFVDAGASVVIAGRNSERGQRALDSIKGPSEKVRFISTDVSQPKDVTRMIDTCLTEFGRLDFAVNNAAAEFPLVPMADIPLESVDRSIDTDLRGTWLCMKAEIEAMLKTGGGAIVNVSSVNGMMASPKAAIYSATKHGVNGLTAAAAREYIGQGIRINTVCPGAIETPRRQRRLTGFTPEQVEAHYADLATRVPAGRVGTSEECAAGIVWLCSDESTYVVGHHLVIDGGLNA